MTITSYTVPKAKLFTKLTKTTTPHSLVTQTSLDKKEKSVLTLCEQVTDRRTTG